MPRTRLRSRTSIKQVNVEMLRNASKCFDMMNPCMLCRLPVCRGSTGFGEAALQSLPGHIGINDVQDCVDALDAAIAAGGWVVVGSRG